MLAIQSKDFLFPKDIPYNKTILPHVSIATMQRNQVMYTTQCGRKNGFFFIVEFAELSSSIPLIKSVLLFSSLSKYFKSI